MAQFSFTTAGQWIATNQTISEAPVFFDIATGGEILYQFAKINNTIDFTGDIEEGLSYISNCSIDISKLPNNKGYITQSNKTYDGFQKQRDDILNPTTTLIAKTLDNKLKYFQETKVGESFTFDANTRLISELQVDTNFFPYPTTINGDETKITPLITSDTQALKINEIIPKNCAIVFYFNAGTTATIEFPTLNDNDFVKNF